MSGFVRTGVNDTCRGGQGTARPASVVGLKFQPVTVAPAGEPVEEFEVGEDEGVVAVASVGVGFGEPGDEVPVGGQKEFLFVRGADGEFDEFLEGLEFIAVAGAVEVELDGEAAACGVGLIGLRGAEDAQHGARGVEVDWLGREEPVFHFLDELPLEFGLLDFGEASEVGVRGKFGGQRAFGAEEEEGEFLEACAALDVEEFGPPIFAGKIFAGEGELLEIVFEEEPCALGIGAGGEDAEHFLASGDGGLGVGEFAAEVGEGAVGFGEDAVVGVVFGCGCGAQTASLAVFFQIVRNSRHLVETQNVSFVRIAGLGQSERKQIWVVLAGVN